MAHHHHETDLDWATLGPMLERGAEVQSPLYAEAIGWIASVAGRDGSPDVQTVVDVGAGPGVLTCVLADAFPSARVIALDGSRELLARAADRAAHGGLGNRVETHVVDLPDGLDRLRQTVGSADVIWMSHVLHHIGDQTDAVRQVGGLLRPDGLLGLVEGGLPTRTLPRDIGIGRPGLEARLDAANEAWFAEMRADLPGSATAVEHWPTLLANAGLRPVGSRTFLLDLTAPLDSNGVEFVRGRLERFREGMAESLDADDMTTLGLLLDEDSAQVLERRTDVFVLSAATVHLAQAIPG
jgi:SAM-dependent methyltransferase